MAVAIELFVNTACGPACQCDKNDAGQCKCMVETGVCKCTLPEVCEPKPIVIPDEPIEVEIAPDAPIEPIALTEEEVAEIKALLKAKDDVPPPEHVDPPLAEKSELPDESPFPAQAPPPPDDELTEKLGPSNEAIAAGEKPLPKGALSRDKDGTVHYPGYSITPPRVSNGEAMGMIEFIDFQNSLRKQMGKPVKTYEQWLAEIDDEIKSLPKDIDPVSRADLEKARAELKSRIKQASPDYNPEPPVVLKEDPESQYEPEPERRLLLFARTRAVTKKVFRCYGKKGCAWEEERDTTDQQAYHALLNGPIRELREAGWKCGTGSGQHIKIIDIDAEPVKAASWKVTKVPYLVMTLGGKEILREDVHGNPHQMLNMLCEDPNRPFGSIPSPETLLPKFTQGRHHRHPFAVDGAETQVTDGSGIIDKIFAMGGSGKIDFNRDYGLEIPAEMVAKFKRSSERISVTFEGSRCPRIRIRLLRIVNFDPRVKGLSVERKGDAAILTLTPYSSALPEFHLDVSKF
jgi:hypothetical protein